jgi:preprotein translocase subunit SecG
MFWIFMLTVHIVVCLILILTILLQSGKGASIGAVFGGGSNQTVFGSTGAGTFLSKLTIGVAAAFMITSITLTYFAGRTISVPDSVVTGQSAPAAPATQPQPVPTQSKETSEAKEKPAAATPAPATGTDAPKQPTAKE